MARISGISIPTAKKIEIALTYIYGIGPKSAAKICDKAHIAKDKRVHQLSDAEISEIRKVIDGEFMVEGDLRREVALSIKRLKEIKSYRGSRHIKNLPCRGQRTHTNARTKKGRSVAIAGKKKAAKK